MLHETGIQYIWESIINQMSISLEMLMNLYMLFNIKKS